MFFNFFLAPLLMLLCFSSPTIAEPSKATSAGSPEAMDSSHGHTQVSSTQDQEDRELEQLKPEELKLLILGTQIYLGRFGYGVGPFTGEMDTATQKALRKYQKYVGIGETGKINKETLKHLTDDNSVLDQILPFLPNYKFDGNHWKETVIAYGTWALENLPVQEALQTSQLSCHKTWNICTVSTAKLVPGYTATLMSQANLYEVQTWNDSEIVTKSLKTGPCHATLLRIQREEKSVTRVTSIAPSSEEACQNVPASREIEMQLADGSQIYRALKNQKNLDAQRILRVKDIAKSSKP